MGSPLGPLFANFYMTELENNVLGAVSPEEKPLVYCRNVDDIFLIVGKYSHLDVLKFTYEVEADRRRRFWMLMLADARQAWKPVSIQKRPTLDAT